MFILLTTHYGEEYSYNSHRVTIRKPTEGLGPMTSESYESVW